METATASTDTATTIEWWIVPATDEWGRREYQISDGPPGERGFSYDFDEEEYNDPLRDGIEYILEQHPNSVFRYVPEYA